MGLAKRIIPTVLNSDSRLVKGKGFKANRVVGHAMQASCIYARREVDELIILDINATENDRDPDYQFVESLTDRCFMPITWGGGIKNLDQVKKLLHSGVDKVSVCTAALNDYNLVKQIAKEVGSQALVVSIDVLGARVVSNGGTRLFDCDAVTWAAIMADCGAGEILLNSVERDGTMVGYDLDLIEAVTEAVDIPVIAAGGCGSYEHMNEALEVGADAVAAGALFTFKDATPKGASSYLRERGWECR